MRPAHVYASMSEQQHTELINALHGPWRNATRITMVVLSAACMSASEIADLLHYDPKTVRAWIARHRSKASPAYPTGPAPDAPAKAAPASANASTPCCRHPGPGPPPASGKPSADPH